VAKLKEQYQGDVLVPASATLVDTLREHDLVDEYHLMVHPVVLGSGKRLFKEDHDDVALPWFFSCRAGRIDDARAYRDAGARCGAGADRQPVRLEGTGTPVNRHVVTSSRS
jgi:hypothetical protein